MVKQIEHLKHATQSNNDKITNLQDYTSEIDKRLNKNINKNIEDRQDLKHIIKGVDNFESHLNRIADAMEKANSELKKEINELKSEVNQLKTRLSTNDIKTNKADKFLEKLNWQIVLALGFVVWILLYGNGG
jgi:exonuclease VII large subunit